MDLVVVFDWCYRFGEVSYQYQILLHKSCKNTPVVTLSGAPVSIIYLYPVETEEELRLGVTSMPQTYLSKPCWTLGHTSPHCLDNRFYDLTEALDKPVVEVIET